MMRIRQLAPVVLFNAAFAAAVLFAANLYLDHSNWLAVSSRAERVRIENSARATDAAYFAQCLAQDHVQMFYPDLVTHNATFRDLAQSTNFLPLGPVPNAQTAYCNEGYGFVTYDSDRYGFRNEDTRWNRPVDVLVVGDSFAQGACVADQYTFSSQLSADLGVNAVNVATGSNGPNHYKALIDVFVPMARPQKVVLVLFPNDNVSIPEEDPYSRAMPAELAKGYDPTGISAQGTEFYEQVRPLLEPSASALEEQIDCQATDLTYPEKTARIVKDHAAGGSGSSFQDYRAELSEPGRLRGLFTLRALRQTAKNLMNPADSPPVLASPDATYAALDALVTTCKDMCEPIVLLLPTSSYWRPDSRADTYFAAVLSHLEKLGGGTEVKILDGRSIVDIEKLSDYAPLGVHLSTEAYRRVGRALGDLVSRQD